MDVSEFQVVFYKDTNEEPVVLEWLRRLPTKARLKGMAWMKRLKLSGHALRRPDADYLGGRIYELRWKFQTVNYRILYFFFGRKMIVLTNGFTKEAVIPAGEMNRALRYKLIFESNPIKHAFVGGWEEEI